MPNSFYKELIQKVWEKGQLVPGLDQDIFRADHCGALIRRDMYNVSDKTLSMGWEIDRIKPLTHGGGNDLSNLQPLQWENNRKKSEDYPAWSCCVTRGNNSNIHTLS